MIHSESIKEISSALSAMQGELLNPAKNKVNPHFGNKYADLTEILDTVRPVLAKHHLAILQNAHCDGDQTYLTTILTHSSGEYFKAITNCKSSKDQLAQGVGSDQTYLKRYQLCAMLGVSAEEDLDGEQIVAKPAAKFVPRVAKVVPTQEGYSHAEVSTADVESMFCELINAAHEGGKDASLKLWAGMNPAIKAIINAQTSKIDALKAANNEWEIKKGMVG